MKRFFAPFSARVAAARTAEEPASILDTARTGAAAGALTVKPFFEQRRERRGLLRGGVAGGMAAVVGAPLLVGCDRVGNSAVGEALLRTHETVNYAVHRALGRRAMAQEFTAADIAPEFRANGTLRPAGDAYARLVASDFTDWRFTVDGLVEQPLLLSLAELKTLPARTQITRHDCVEGWSCIGQWTGVRLSHVLRQARLKPDAKYVVFHCLDRMEGHGGLSGEAPLYYESVDLDDAMHEQTILAWALNGKPLPVANGAPLRARIERQLGYKHAKYLHRVELVATLAGIGGGKGGYWEDQGYNWYAGI